MNGFLGGQTMDDEVVISRFVAVVQQKKPRGKGPNYGREITGATRWIRKLYDQITALRDADWGWSDIVESLSEANVPLGDGRKWTVATTRRLYNQETARRAGKGGWRAIKRARTAPAVSEEAPTCAPATSPIVRPVSEKAEKPADAGKAHISLVPERLKNMKLGAQPPVPRRPRPWESGDGNS